MPHGKMCYLEIPANRVEDSARSYSDIFGWKVRERGDGNLAFDDTGGVSGTWVKEGDRTPDERTLWPSFPSGVGSRTTGVSGIARQSRRKSSSWRAHGWSTPAEAASTWPTFGTPTGGNPSITG